MTSTELHPPCQNVKTNRILLFALTAFCIGWMSWLSLAYINIKLDSKVALATINVKLVNIQKDILEIKKDNDDRTSKILDYIATQRKE